MATRRERERGRRRWKEGGSFPLHQSWLETPHRNPQNVPTKINHYIQFPFNFDANSFALRMSTHQIQSSRVLSVFIGNMAA
jgi:hypothetical protein